MSKNPSLEVLNAHAEDLATLFEVLAASHAKAVVQAKPGPSALQRVSAAVFDVAKGSLHSLSKRRPLALGWLVVCGVTALALGLSFLGVLEALALFLLGPMLVFGWFHSPAAFRKHFQSTGARVLLKAQPEVFVAQDVDVALGKLFGVRISKEGHKTDWLEMVGATATAESIPAAYVCIRHPNGELVHLLNVHSGAYANWPRGIEMLVEDSAKYGDAFLVELGQAGLLSSLRDLAELLGPADQTAVVQAPVSFKPKATKVETNVSATWDDLVLSDAFKEELQAYVAMFKNAPALRRLAIEPPSALMLYGAPGTGKTQVARTLATMGGMNFLAKVASDLKGEYIGHSAPKVRELFAEARELSPCILFIDEIESVTARRDGGLVDKDRISDEVVAELLDQMDGLLKRNGDVFVVAATNHLEMVDSAVLSRFQNKKVIALPDTSARSRMLEVFLAGKPVDERVYAALPALALQTEGRSGRDIRGLVDAAAHRAVTRALKEGDVDKTKLVLEDFEG